MRHNAAINPPRRKPRRRGFINKTFGILLNFGIIILLVLCCIAAYNVVKPLVDYKNGGEAYENVAGLAFKKPLHSADNPSVSGKSPYETGFNSDGDNLPDANGETFAIDFEYLKTLSKDVAAWIQIPGTQVNYPVMQGSDNEYYLKRLYNGKYNSMGSIFIDAVNSLDFSDRNTILHGHNMKNGSMFASLLKYREQNYYDSHPEILLYTESGDFKLEIISAYTTISESESYKISFIGEDEFAEFVAEAASLSDFVSPVKYTPGDRLVTLSTCTTTGGYTEYRYVVHALLRN